MKILELFCGTKSFANVCEERGHPSFTVDIDKKFDPDLCKDILNLTPNDIPFKPDVIWASPPCTTFSVAGRSSNYTNFMPNSVKACIGLALVYKNLELIKELKPKYFFVENPMGYLRKFPFMMNYHRNTVTYCQYGDKRMKPTDIWTNHGGWYPKKMCKNGDNCHEAAPRGNKTGTQGLKDNEERSIVPKELCLEIIKACEVGLNEN